MSVLGHDTSYYPTASCLDVPDQTVISVGATLYICIVNEVGNTTVETAAKRPVTPRQAACMASSRAGEGALCNLNPLEDCTAFPSHHLDPENDTY